MIWRFHRATKSTVAAFGGLVLLKTFQRLGYFPLFDGLPPRLIQHLATAMGMLLPHDALQQYEQRRLPRSRTCRRFALTSASRPSATVVGGCLVGALLEAAQSKDILADLINVGH